MATASSDLAATVTWADLADEAVFLPRVLSSQVFGPDANGIKTLVSVRIDCHGRLIKTTTTSRVRKALRTNRSIERRSWRRFGDAGTHPSDEGGMPTVVSMDEIFFEKPKAAGSISMTEDTKDVVDSLTGLGTGSNTLILCRICSRKGDHWTARCRYRGVNLHADHWIATPEAHGPVTAAKYVHPKHRVGKEGTGQERKYKDEDHTLKVSNLSEDTQDVDLFELFGVFGSVKRVRISTYAKTHISKGFGFVTFFRKEDAERAILKLDGYGYDNLIIRVEWASRSK